VSPRAPYRHFATREALLAAVAVEGFATFMAALEVRLEAAGRSPIARLRAVAEAYVVFAVERPGTFRVMHAPYALVEETAPELVGARAASHARSMAIIAEGQAAGVLRSGDPMHLALACWASMHGVAVLLIEGQLGRFDRAVDAEGIARLVSGLVVEGVATRG
jgi:AcrR family transcriptional regulator